MPLESEHLLRIDATTSRITADTPLPNPISFSVVADRSLWLVVYSETAQVWRLNPSTLEQRSAIPIRADFLFGLAADESGALWTTDHHSGAVWRINPGDSRAVQAFDLGHHPIEVAAGEHAVWIGVQGPQFAFR